MSNLKDTIAKILEDAEGGNCGTVIDEPLEHEGDEIEFDILDLAENPYVEDPVNSPVLEDDGFEAADPEVSLDPSLDDLENNMTPYNKTETQIGQNPMPTMPVAEMGTYMRESIEALPFEDVKVDRAALDKLFEGAEFTAEFKDKAAKIFEDACNAKVAEVLSSVLSTITESAESLYQKKINEEVAAIKAIAEETSAQWLTENQIAIESSTRTDIAESFMNGLRKLFVEHYIDIPESKVDLLEAFQGRIEKLEVTISEEMKKTVEAKKALNESQKQLSVLNFTKGMTTLQASKVTSIAESVEFTTAEEFTAKLKTLTESATTVAAPALKAPVLETIGAPVVEKPVIAEGADEPDPIVQSYIRHARSNSLYD